MKNNFIFKMSAPPPLHRHRSTPQKLLHKTIPQTNAQNYCRNFEKCNFNFKSFYFPVYCVCFWCLLTVCVFLLYCVFLFCCLVHINNNNKKIIIIIAYTFTFMKPFCRPSDSKITVIVILILNPATAKLCSGLCKFHTI